MDTITKWDAPGILKRFKKKYTIDPNTNCWIWTGCTRNNKGLMSINREQMLAPRISYELYIDYPWHNCHIKHRCKNTLCVNPAHLYYGDEIPRKTFEVAMVNFAKKPWNGDPDIIFTYKDLDDQPHNQQEPT